MARNLELQRKKRSRKYVRRNIRVRDQFLAAYGKQCACCGEKEPAFLTMQHIFGRNKTVCKRSSYRERLRLKRAGWPKEEIELLCFNCNCVRGIQHRPCPHEVTLATAALVA